MLDRLIISAAGEGQDLLFGAAAGAEDDGIEHSAPHADAQLLAYLDAARSRKIPSLKSPSGFHDLS
jgi:hypothetical protein